MYLPRNPFTPGENESFTPAQYLERFLVFGRWKNENHINHSENCLSDDHKLLLRSNMCCLPSLKTSIDNTLLLLAGCKSGFWKEPAGFQYWLAFAWKRLEELEDFHDYYLDWTNTIKEKQSEMLRWKLKTKSVKIPGFNIDTFIKACRKYHYEPDKYDVSVCFNISFDSLNAYMD